MSTATILVGLGAFLACAVEMVEALTIVLGVGTVRGWRSTLIGVGAATFVLTVLVAALGPALQQIPIDALRLVVGGLLLVVVAGVLARGPLERVPENTIKFAVGLLLTSFGCFWGAEGAGASWPGDELSLLALIAFLSGFSWLLVRALRRRRLALTPAG